MDSYLSKVKKSSDTKHVKKEKPKEVVSDVKEFKQEEKEFYSKNKSFFQKFLDFIAGEPEEKDEKEIKAEEKAEVKEEEKELEEYSKKTPKKGILETIKNFFVGEDIQGEEKAEEEKKAELSINEDIKEVLKIQNKWLLKLPVKTIKEFKDSEDYKIYKETLKKYNLIKIKEVPKE